MKLIKKAPKWCKKCHYKARNNYNKNQWKCEREECGHVNLSYPLFQWIRSLIFRSKWCPQCNVLMKREKIAREWNCFTIYEFTCPLCKKKETVKYSIFF